MKRLTSCEINTYYFVSYILSLYQFFRKLLMAILSWIPKFPWNLSKKNNRTMNTKILQKRNVASRFSEHFSDKVCNYSNVASTLRKYSLHEPYCLTSRFFFHVLFQFYASKKRMYYCNINFLNCFTNIFFLTKMQVENERFLWGKICNY